MPSYHIEIDETGGFIFPGHCGSSPSDEDFNYLKDRKVWHQVIDAIFDGEVLEFEDAPAEKKQGVGRHIHQHAKHGGCLNNEALLRAFARRL